MKRILNFGSLNMDYVYRVPHLVQPGETLQAINYQVFAGGKGANQSAALALAGSEVIHGGRIGLEGRWLIDELRQLGVDTRFIIEGEIPTGHAMIQVDTVGENAIVLYPGANHSLTPKQITNALEHFAADDILLLQNETNQIPYLMHQASARGLHIYFNPAPFTPEVLQYPLQLVHTFILNQTEAIGLAGIMPPKILLASLSQHYPNAAFILTLGREGAHYLSNHESFNCPAKTIKTVDSTAAGDTFIGYFLASITKSQTIAQAMDLASKAAALCVSRPGAMGSIPNIAEVKSET